MRPKLLRFRRHNSMRDEAMRVTDKSMNELEKIMGTNSYFTDWETHPSEQRLALARVFGQQKWLLRRLYLKYSIFLVNAPDKAFKMNPAQWTKLIKDSGCMGKAIDAKAITDIFSQA